GDGLESRFVDLPKHWPKPSPGGLWRSGKARMRRHESETSRGLEAGWMKAPRKFPSMLPTPPRMGVPPMTAAAIASSSMPVPCVGVTVWRWPREMRLAIPAARAPVDPDAAVEQRRHED